MPRRLHLEHTPSGVMVISHLHRPSLQPWQVRFIRCAVLLLLLLFELTPAGTHAGTVLQAVRGGTTCLNMLKAERSIFRPERQSE